MFWRFEKREEHVTSTRAFFGLLCLDQSLSGISKPGKWCRLENSGLQSLFSCVATVQFFEEILRISTTGFPSLRPPSSPRIRTTRTHKKKQCRLSGTSKLS